MKINIKAHHITNLSDARYFAAKEVKLLSFNFKENKPNYIDPIKAKAMMEWIEGPMIIGEFDGLSADEIRFYTEGWQLDMISVGPMTSSDILKNLEGIEVIKDYVVEEFTNADYLISDMKKLEPFVEAFSLDFNTNNIAFDCFFEKKSMITWDDLKAICSQFKIILNIDFKAENLEKIMKLPLYGLCISGGDEERVGVKSFDELEEIFDKLEVIA